MIKFRCQRCAQKIAVDDEGSGVVIDCPTCAESLIIPPCTDREFIAQTTDAVSLELVREPAPVIRTAWPRAIVEKLLPALLSQRRELLATQDAATEHLAVLEQRVVLMKIKFQRRVNYYQERVSALEAENRELSEKVRSRDDGAAQVTAFGTGRINLRNTGFLLRM